MRLPPHIHIFMGDPAECVACLVPYDATQREMLARAIWLLLVEDYAERDGQSGMPAFMTYADTPPDVDEPCEFEEQSEELREWARWRAGRLLELAGMAQEPQLAGDVFGATGADSKPNPAPTPPESSS